MESQQLPPFSLPPPALRLPPTSSFQIENQEPPVPLRVYYCIRAYHGYTIPQPHPDSLRRAPPFRGWAADMNAAEQAQKHAQRARGFKNGMYWLFISLFIMVIVVGCCIAGVALIATWKPAD